MYSNYWSNSRFADWLRGVEKPHSLSLTGWKTWEKSSKKSRPIRHWFAEELLDYLQDTWMFIPNQLHKAAYYINNRFVEKRHYLKTRLKAGAWHEFDERLLHGAFEELVDFVEIEKAYHHVATDRSVVDQYKIPFWRKGIFGISWHAWRCPEAGIEYLKWEAALKKSDNMGYPPNHSEYGSLTDQAQAAEECMALYFWWKNRKYRSDINEESGLSGYYEDKRRSEGRDPDELPSFDFKDPNDKTTWQILNEKQMQIEARNDQEDTNMLIRLVKLRSELWT